MQVSIGSVIALGTFENFVASKLLMKSTTLLARLRCVCLSCLNNSAPWKKSSFGFQRFSKRIVRPTTHLSDRLGLYLSIGFLYHSRDLELGDENDPIVFTEKESQLVMAFLDLVFYLAELAMISTT